ncbi:YhdT family protein [Proteus hauseri]|uniref:YhdT family protein n=1 Tax=Proteus hauseri TaxID=183417 RepID=UPI0032D9DB7A
MDKRFVQAHKEALWALILTFMYLFGWLITAYLPDNTLGIIGLPLWFELSCVFLPILFFLLCYLMVRYFFKDMPLGDEHDDAN